MYYTLISLQLIAPTIHHAICQDTLVSSADNLSSSLTKFSKTWAPLASSQQPSVHKLTQEAGHLEDLVERLRKDVKAGKLGKMKTTEQIVNLDSPLRKMTMQIIETAKVGLISGYFLLVHQFIADLFLNLR